MPTRNANVFTFFVVLTIIVSFTSAAFAQNIKDDKMTGGKTDRADVIYAIDGYLTDSSGDLKPFIFGAVKLHKKNAPENEWTRPLFYFEFDNKRTFAGEIQYEYFTQPRDDGTLEMLPILKGFYAAASNYDYIKYDNEDYSPHGLAKGSTPRDFEINFAFTKNGDIDTEKSSVGIVQEEHRTGRKVKKSAWFGDYYIKGSKTERFVPEYNANGKIVNMDKTGEPIYEERIIDESDVCYEYNAVAITPSTTIIPWKEKEKTPYDPQNDLSSNNIPPKAQDITPSLTPPPKEKIESPENRAHYTTTGLCSVYKINSISRSTGLPDARALGLIS